MFVINNREIVFILINIFWLVGYWLGKETTKEDAEKEIAELFTKWFKENKNEIH